MIQLKRQNKNLRVVIRCIFLRKIYRRQPDIKKKRYLTQPNWYLYILVVVIDNWKNHNIVSGCLNFDPEARRILYEKYSAQMYSICLRYSRDKEDADDIFQQAFYLVYKNLEQLKNTNALSGWIKTIFVNTALKHISNTKLSRHSDIDEIGGDHITEDWNHALSNLGTDELTNLIQQLPSGSRTVFNMYIIDGFSHKEISLKLNISIGTSKSQLHDARKWLQKKIINNTKVNHI